MKYLAPLVILVCVPFLMASNSKIPQTVSHLSSTMEHSSNDIIKAFQQNQDNAFPDNS